jgi:hypothetical protein
MKSFEHHYSLLYQVFFIVFCMKMFLFFIFFLFLLLADEAFNLVTSVFVFGKHISLFI